MTSESPTASPTESPAAPCGTREAVHEQAVDGFGTVRVVPVDPAADAGVIHRWVIEERARFWGMGDASREQVLEIYTHLDSLTTHHAFLALLGDEPVALFQTYEPSADRVGECYDVDPGDVGVHLMLGPAAGEPRPGYTAALLSVFVSHVLSVPGRQRIVAEPDARNEKAITRLQRTGFVLGPEIVLPEIDLPEVYLPEKRARLAFLTQESFAGRS
ncbi:acetyltransferase [Streptomyces sp. A3M-1-3]|uniref:GNAT family N-acetyltransferase n=1 Tax=Streptomyces sp. A3M-1-3 TaxID=2962044 RepID=UPI0020B8FC8F|nr:GNAT family N-acetyltransferase [Streptomyces sp. A3M-1-3]MCP3817175.1 acetyltransferase [Streptomyces sp. A3M-1-3]